MAMDSVTSFHPMYRQHAIGCRAVFVEGGATDSTGMKNAGPENTGGHRVCG